LAQASCDANLEPQKTFGYEQRGTGEAARCEGFYIAPIAGQPIQLVSLTVGSVSIPPEGIPEIILKPSGASHLTGSTVNIRAESQERRSYYRLDAQVPLAGQLRWPLNDIVLQRPDLKGAIGVYGFAVESTQTTYVPLALWTAQRLLVSGNLSLVVRAGRDLEDVRWRQRVDTPAGQFDPWHEAADEIYAGDTAMLELPATPSERVVVEITGRASGTTDEYNISVHLVR
jgi:hypothetical protein